MNGLEVAVLVGVILLVGGVLAQKLRVSGPIVLLILGGAAGFIPLFDEIQLPPDLVLLLFLPAILYWESLNSSLREIRRNLRVILLQAVPLVLVTAAAVAILGHGFGLPWSVAIALGAIVAPTDATAIASVAGRMPRRPLTILRAESLINDGTALSLYAVAVTASVAERSIQLGEGVLQFVIAYAGGIAIGAAAALLIVAIRRLLTNRLLSNTLSVLTPFVVYLPAELANVSGVVAVVTAGITIGHYTPRIVDASTRTQVYGFWGLTSYILNGSLFVLVGLELHAVIAEIDGDWDIVISLGLLTALAVIVVRLAWGFTTPYLIRALDRRPSQRARRVRARQRFPIAWAGFRGAVSLAAALALPTTLQSGDGFPNRNLIIAVTTIVILVTLILQGSTLGAVVRWARFPRDSKAEEEFRHAEETALGAVLDALPGEADKLDAPQELRDLLQREYSDRLDEYTAHGDDGEDGERPEEEVDREGPLRLALLAVKREAVIGLRDRNEIDDDVLRRIQARIDLEELRLSRSMPDET